MTEVEVYVLANNQLNKVIQQIKDDQWNLPIPEWFQVGRAQGDMTLRTIINYHAYDDIWVSDTLAGKTIAEVGDKYDGDLLGDDPKAKFAEITERGIVAAKDLSDLDTVVHLTYGDFPAREYFKHITSFRGFRAYDIAKLIGIQPDLPPELVQGLWDEIEPEVEQWRQIGVFGPAIEPPVGADLQTKLFCLCGRSL
jgi:hypothetical protein